MTQLVARRNLICQCASVHNGDNFKPKPLANHTCLLALRCRCEHNEFPPKSRTLGRRVQNGARSVEKYAWNANTYRAHEAGPREIGKQHAIEYAAAFGVPLMWLLTGLDDTAEKDDSPSTGTAPTIGNALTAAQIGLRVVPLVNEAAFGEMNNPIHRLAELATGFVAVADQELSDDVFAYRITDKSMEGRAPQALALGDVVIVDRKAAVEPGCVVIAGLPTGKIAVRIYGELSGQPGAAPRVSLSPVNSYFAQTIHERDALAFLFRVAVVQRRL